MYFEFIVVIVVTEALTELLVNSEIFLPVRKWFFSRRSIKVFDFIHDILDCAYCTSVWVALPVSLFLTDINIFNPFVDWFFIWLLVHRVVSVINMLVERIKGIV